MAACETSRFAVVCDHWIALPQFRTVSISFSFRLHRQLLTVALAVTVVDCAYVDAFSISFSSSCDSADVVDVNSLRFSDRNADVRVFFAITTVQAAS